MQRIIKKLLLLVSVFSIPLIAIEDKPKDVYLAEKVAAGNDWLINKGEKAPLLKPLTSIASRTMSITLFPLCTAVDMTVLAAKQAREVPYILSNKDSAQHQEQYRKNKEALRKSSLGLLTAPIGILSPDIVTHHFIPNNIQTFQITPYGKLYSTRAHIVYPQSIADVKLIINEAQRSGKSISTLGKSMSQGKQAISNKDWNIVINTSNLNQILIDPNTLIGKPSIHINSQSIQRIFLIMVFLQII